VPVKHLHIYQALAIVEILTVNDKYLKTVNNHSGKNEVEKDYFITQNLLSQSPPAIKLQDGIFFCSATLWTRFARFFLAHDTKTGKNVPN
jgi:hypothetical protein